MLKKILLGAILGGVVAFVWSWISWTVLPWHDTTIHSFKDGDAVRAAISANAPVTGVYVLPNMPPETTNPEAQQTVEAEWQKQYAEGPIGLLSIQREGATSMAPMLVGGFVLNVLAAAILSWLIVAAGLRTSLLKLTFVVVVALFASVVSHLTAWNWWGTALDYTAVMVVDTVVTWLLAGFATPGPRADRAPTVRQPRIARSATSNSTRRATDREDVRICTFRIVHQHLRHCAITPL